jgi:hypothetical protein
MKLRIPLLLMCATLASCAGGGSAVQPIAPAAVVPDSNGTSITSTIVVPAPQAQSNARSPQYVSASTLGLKVTVTDIPPTGKTASFTPITSVYSLSIGANQVVIPTPATAAGHTEDLTYVTYNLAPVANAIPANAKALSWGLTTGFVVQPGQNTNNIVLSAVADSFTAPLAESGSFGMMSANPPVLIGAQTSLGLGGNAVPNGTPVLFDAGLNNITTAAGAPWSIVGAVPTTATTAATGIPVTIAETAGTCGAIGTGPHLQLALNGGAPATSVTIGSTTDTVQAIYDGNGGAGWFAIVSAKAQTQTLTYTLSSLAVTAVVTPSNAPDWNCGAQTVAFSQSTTEKALATIVQHIPAGPYWLTVPNTAACTGLVTVYAGNSTAPPSQIPYGAATSLVANTQFTMQIVPAPTSNGPCNIEIQDNNAILGITGGATFPGATTYVQVEIPQGTGITVP